MKQTNKELLTEIYPNLQSVSNLTGTTFTFDYWVTKNIERIISIFTPMQKALASKDLDEYKTEIQKINQKHAAKDENGNPKTETNAQGQQAYVFATPAARQIELDALLKKYKPALDAAQQREKEYSELMDKETEFIPYKLKLSVWEENKGNVPGLTANHLIKLMPLIDEDEKVEMKIKRAK